MGRFSDIDVARQEDGERNLVVVGWDGRSRPMYRYEDEMRLPDSARSIVRPEDRPDKGFDVWAIAAESRVTVETVLQWIESGWTPDSES